MTKELQETLKEVHEAENQLATQSAKQKSVLCLSLSSIALDKGDYERALARANEACKYIKYLADAARNPRELP